MAIQLNLPNASRSKGEGFIDTGIKIYYINKTLQE